MFNRSNVDISDEENSDNESSRSPSPTIQTLRATPADSWHDVKSDSEERRSNRSDPLDDQDRFPAQTTNSSHPSPDRQDFTDDENELSDDDDALDNRRDTLSAHSSMQSDSKPSTNISNESDRRLRDNLLDKRIDIQRSSSPLSDSEQQIGGSLLINSKGRNTDTAHQHQNNSLISTTSIDNFGGGNPSIPKISSMQSGTDTSITAFQQHSSIDDHNRFSSFEENSNNAPLFTREAYPPTSSLLMNTLHEEKTTTPLSSTQSQPLNEEKLSSLSSPNSGTNSTHQSNSFDANLQSLPNLINNQSITGTTNTSIWSQSPGNPGAMTSGRDSRSLSQLDQPWENPYWKNQPSQSTASPSPTVTLGNSTSAPPASSAVASAATNAPAPAKQVDTTGKPKDQSASWVNPYWKTNTSSSLSTPSASAVSQSQDQSSKTPTKSDKTWVNPYWKDQQSTPSATSAVADPSQKTNQNSSAPAQPNKTWVNPYWKDQQSPPSATSAVADPSQKTNQNSSAPAQPNKTWVNPYWKDQQSPPSATSAVADPSQKTNQNSSTPAQTNKPWENPYWKDKQPQSTAPPSTSSGQTQWQNPYWKDKPTSAGNSTGASSSSQAQLSPPKQDKPWENPYWKDKPSQQISATSSSSHHPAQGTQQSTKQNSTTWINPYWGNTSMTTNPLKASTSSATQNQPWVNPYWKDSKPQEINQTKTSSSFTFAQDNNGTTKTSQQNGGRDSPTESNAPPVPPFFQRIFPSPTASSISKRANSVQADRKPTFETPQPPSTQNTKTSTITDDDERLPFTVDHRGVLHFQKDNFFSSSSKLAKTDSSSAARPPPASTSSQFQFANPPVPVPAAAAPPPPITVHSSSPRVISTMTSIPTTAPSGPPSATSKLLPSMSFINTLVSSRTAVIITEQEINDIQHALQNFEKNSNSIPVIQTSQTTDPKPSPNTNTPYTALNNMWTPHPQPPSNQTMSPKVTPQYTPYNPPNIISSLATINPSNPNQSNSFDRPIQPKPIVHI